MNILIATDGTLPLAETVAHLQRIYRDGDTVAVMTAINLPRRLINALKGIDPSNPGSVETIVDAAGAAHGGLGGGDRVAQQLVRDGAATWPVEEIIDGYFRRVGEQCTQPMVDALAESGIPAKRVIRETEDRTAATILEVVEDLDVGLLVMGSIGRGRFEGLVGSTGTKLFRHAPCDVLLVRVESD